MQTFQLETTLPAPLAVIWDHLNRTRLLFYVARGMIAFQPVDPVQLPDRWQDGAYRMQMWLWGWIPMGWQVIRFESQQPFGDTLRLRDNGFGMFCKRWDHVVTVSPLGQGTRYADNVTIDAGILTPLVVAFARRFYAHRQRRWQALVASDFNYDAG